MAAPKGNQYAKGCETSGAPTKYRPEFVDEMIEYFDSEPFEELDIHHYKNGELAWTDKKRVPRKLPTMVGFWRHLKSKGYDIGIRTLYDWIDKDHDSYQEEFSQTYTRHAKPLQKDHLIQNGLQGTNNPIFGKFVATNLTDMEDKKGHEVTGKDGGPVETSFTVNFIKTKEK
jgi:hypothetical protein